MPVDENNLINTNLFEQKFDDIEFNSRRFVHQQFLYYKDKIGTRESIVVEKYSFWNSRTIHKGSSGETKKKSFILLNKDAKKDYKTHLIMDRLFINGSIHLEIPMTSAISEIEKKIQR